MYYLTAPSITENWNIWSATLLITNCTQTNPGLNQSRYGDDDYSAEPWHGRMWSLKTEAENVFA